MRPFCFVAVSDAALCFCVRFYDGDESHNTWRGKGMSGVFLFVSDSVMQLYDRF